MTSCKRAITALLVGKQDRCLPNLQECLDTLGMKTSSVERPSDVALRLGIDEAPELIFAVAEPGESTWSEVVELAREMGGQPVIVASRVADVRFYLDTLEGGAFDFVAAPFRPCDLRDVVDSAMSQSHLCARA